jgi:DNA repair photolyase
VFVRWKEQSVEADATGRLPGYADSVVRTFKAPNSLDVRFHEVRAKSALNRVPAASRVPFEWTVNPYRGCLHACQFCTAGDTPILMADGRTRAMADLRPGDEIYGTELRGRYRRYAKTQVLDHWSVIKPAFRTVLADGTELITSGDHRFLTERGWKHVTGAMAGPEQRPHLTPNNSLLGTGGFASSPLDTPDYRRGYLSGMIRGGGNLASYSYERAGRTHGDVHRFRLALCDEEALDRSQAFLRAESVSTDRFAFAAGSAVHRPANAIRTQKRPSVEDIREIIRWPTTPSDDWRKGFLAGIFDAEGSCTASTSALRIANTAPVIIAWTDDCLRHFGFDSVVEARSVRLRGGLKEQLRFFHLTDPAVTRKRDIDGLALKSDAELRVVSIEPLGMAMRLYDITTGTGDFIANGVVSHNCFARPTHEYLEFDAGRDFEREIVVKVNIPEVLRAELARPSWKGDHVALGTNTDPYQWVEKRYRLMRGIWEAFRDASNPCSILTKSPLLLRDADLLQEIAQRTTVSACLSIPTMDEKAWRASEPHTPHPKARLDAVKELNRLGIPTGVLVAPLMPGINDAPEQVERVLDACREAGAVSIGGQALFLAGSTKGVFMEWLQGYRPDLVPEYERLYEGRARLRKEDRERVEAPLKRRRRYRPKSEARFARPGEAARVAPKPEDWPIRDPGVGETVRSAAEVATGPVRTNAPLTPAQRAAALAGQESLF